METGPHQFKQAWMFVADTVQSVLQDEMNTVKWFPVRDQTQLTMKIIVMLSMMISPDGGYNQGSHFEHTENCAKKTHTHIYKKEETYD